MPCLARRQAGATSALLVVLASEHLDLAPSGYGWLLGAIGIGAVLGPYALTRLVTDPRRPAYVFGPYVLRGTVDLVLATAEVRGRVFAGFDLIWQLGRLVSLLLGGLLAAAIGIQAVYYLGGGLLLLAGAIGWRGVRTQ